MKKAEFKEILALEKSIYTSHVLYSGSTFLSMLKNEAPYRIWKWLRLSRYADYYRRCFSETKGVKRIIYQTLYVYYIRRKQILGEKLSLEIGTEHIGVGLVIYHYNNVINGNAVIGKNCHIHGTVVIGNNGKTNECPVIGDNVMVGAGAKIIGNVKIADNIKIAAGAVVVNSFMEPGITIAGIPARKINKN
ncbi:MULTISPECIES: serine O-acetyltransferase [Paraprevotella]|uniref:2,3,4,5-tetrahydropyridine-2,6-dicarboxylate N-acetyltransferase domain protein n=1 Tax=Paraprevotella clara YIT 11840 TaxID=762968 RepID=G5SPU2_9BACT|nr:MULTISPECIES: 2,3,4,5-tetrahydropyridine-2,6-carboxylate N-succinyltransferase [Paraprevotella]EHH00658.1 2,3,4,5-tetrahydropyridine-2,6-dicarboxylate N-acetyltransferase domain protein [Paraprevotella clara YIT 11840]